MKKNLLLLFSTIGLTGCIVYHPGPIGEYGFTYDTSLPRTDTALAATTPTVYRPIATTSYEQLPAPPSIPPVYSDIPEPLPRETAPAITERTVLLPPATAIREPAGARVETQSTTVTQPTAVPAPVVAPYPVYGGDTFFGGGGATNDGGTNAPIIATNPPINTVTNIATSVNAVRSNFIRRGEGIVTEPSGAAPLPNNDFRFNRATNFSVPPGTTNSGFGPAIPPTTSPTPTPTPQSSSVQQQPQSSSAKAVQPTTPTTPGQPFAPPAPPAGSTPVNPSGNSGSSVRTGTGGSGSAPVQTGGPSSGGTTP